jgi:uncharacterized membrane protein
MCRWNTNTGDNDPKPKNVQMEHKILETMIHNPNIYDVIMTSFSEITTKVTKKNNQQKEQLTPTSLLALPISSTLLGEFILVLLLLDAPLF